MLDLTQYQDENMDELTVAEEGEYDIRLVKFMTDKSGEVMQYYGEEEENPYFNLLFEVIDHPDADSFKNFTYFVGLPCPDDEPKQKRQKLNRVKSLGEALGIDFFGSEIDVLEYNGKVSCSAVLTVAEDDVYGERNEIKQILVPR